jgi:hypothetical protein
MNRAIGLALITGAAFAAVTVFLYFTCLSSSGGGHGALPGNVLLFLIVLAPATWLRGILRLPMLGSIKELSFVFVAVAATLNAIIGATLAYIIAATWRTLRRSSK